MTGKKDMNVAAVEKAIAKKYGAETIVNPMAGWTAEQEEEYLRQSEQLQENMEALESQNEKVEVDGVLMPKKLLNKETKRVCPVCTSYSFNWRDDLYMTKFECCGACYIQWVENREERWATGWRPDNNNEQFKNFKKETE